ncbi:DsbA family protein [Streptomyces pactum]|uniref:2-hydroxychromene-2-carboxylate isomerase n=1 Tax=Streptomyces pactum TaxID=68249 RepID=A0ABS0NIL4_9ACTN|nr:DsbA family protein [Streptomyces pactum]
MAGRRARAPKVPRFYFNFRSPYSWLAYRDLLDRYPDVARAVEWHPWWDPDESDERALREAGGSFSYVAMSRDKHLYLLQDVRRLARQRGLSVTWPVDEDPEWSVPHYAYFVALRAGKGPEYLERVHRARWLEGEDICDRKTVARLAEELGLPAERMATAADDPALREREGLPALLTQSRDGVFGVPFFILGYEKFWGLDRLPAFVDAVRARSGTPAGPAEPESGGPDFLTARAGEQGHAGGCG